MLGRFEEAKDQLIQGIELAKKFSKSEEGFRRLLAYVYLKSGKPDRALQECETVWSGLAEAYYKSRDLNKAREEYDRIIALTAGRLFFGDIYAKSFYMLGKIYEQQGDKDKGIEHYEKFIDLWKDADPGMAEVDDARKRLAGLRSQ